MSQEAQKWKRKVRVLECAAHSARFNVVHVIHQVGERIVESNDENLPVHRAAVDQCDRAQLSAARIKQSAHDE